jgi:NAD(P)-dependent dehydrogenase (short-subunit alcohol dehydrogenase family)
VLVIGSSFGLGVARGAAREGATVMLASRNAMSGQTDEAGEAYLTCMRATAS